MQKHTLIASALLGSLVITAVLVARSDASQPGPAGAPIGSPVRVLEDRTSRAYLHSYNLPAHGVALQGFSPVSYFEGQAEPGNALFAAEHDGVTYHLTSAEQVAAFSENPAKFVPAYGGWCAFGMSVSDKFPVDPTNFEIVDGKLLLFLRNPGVDARELWNKGDEAKLVRKAEAHWKKVQG